ncbi:unnamed protein product, partial [Didymodactylos carnosus]
PDLDADRQRYMEKMKLEPEENQLQKDGI